MWQFWKFHALSWALSSGGYLEALLVLVVRAPLAEELDKVAAGLKLKPVMFKTYNIYST